MAALSPQVLSAWISRERSAAGSVGVREQPLLASLNNLMAGRKSCRAVLGLAMAEALELPPAAARAFLYTDSGSWYHTALKAADEVEHRISKFRLRVQGRAIVHRIIQARQKGARLCERIRQAQLSHTDEQVDAALWRQEGVQEWGAAHPNANSPTGTQWQHHTEDTQEPTTEWWQSVAIQVNAQHVRWRQVLQQLTHTVQQENFQRTWIEPAVSNVLIVKVKSHQEKDRRKAEKLGQTGLKLEPAIFQVRANDLADDQEKHRSAVPVKCRMRVMRGKREVWQKGNLMQSE